MNLNGAQIDDVYACQEIYTLPEFSGSESESFN